MARARWLPRLLAFTEDKTEWTGTDIAFDITENDGQTEVRFTHIGLTPEFECFENCSNAWGFYIKESVRRGEVSRSPSPLVTTLAATTSMIPTSIESQYPQLP